jgi:hypothetical protein
MAKMKKYSIVANGDFGRMEIARDQALASQGPSIGSISSRTNENT